VGVLLVLGVTLGAVVVFTQVLGFQAGVLTSLQALDVRRLGESLVPVEGVSVGGKIILYNNGLIPTCFLELRVVGIHLTATPLHPAALFNHDRQMLSASGPQYRPANTSS
jgi:hypothetical protein